MAEFVTRQRQTTGVPLGALGAGSIELCPDGEFHKWQIANAERWRQDCRERPEADDGEGLTGGLSFYVRTQTSEGGVVLRRLGLGLGSGYGTEEYNYRMFSFHKPVEEISFDGRFPTASLIYRDQALPVDIRLKAASPFVPYDERTSGTPGVYLTFEVRNRSEAPVDVSLSGKLRNMVAAGPDGRGQRVHLLREPGHTTVLIKSGQTAPPAPDSGSLALCLEGGDISWLCGEYRGYMNEYVAHGSLCDTEESFLFGLRQRGRLPDIHAGERPDWKETLSRVDELTAGEMDKMFAELEQYGFSSSILERLHLAAPELFQKEESKREALRYLLQNWSELDEKWPWGDAALCASLRLEPGESRQVRFILAWHFPHLCSAGGRRVGHMYENWFPDAAAVSAYLRQERKRILPAVEQFTDTLYDTSFPDVFPEAVSAHLSTLVKCSWWSQDGDFGVWEGLGSCGLHTTDVAYHGSHSLLALFPALQLKQMRMTAAFQREDGCIPHFFTPDFKSVDNGFDRVDMNPQFVLLVCRDYLATGELAYAAEMWPHIVAAMEQTSQLDADGDGLPDTNAGRNTYDAWKFSGTSTYISVLWLAALKAAALLADACGKPEQAAAWRELSERGAASLEEKLWGGEYYNLWVDGASKDECCMTDQLDGVFFARLLGLGGIIPEERTQTVLESIWKYNYSDENGLINASCPPGKKFTLHTFRNCQGLANWSGIEYMMAAFYTMTGHYDRGLRLVEGVLERHRRLGQIWNHAECGDYYYRPLSSWLLLQALSGASFDRAGKSLTLQDSAANTPFHSPWFSAGGYGRIDGGPGRRKVSCIHGQTDIGRILLPGEKSITDITLNSQPLAFETQPRDGLTEAAFPPVSLHAGSSLEIQWS